MMFQVYYDVVLTDRTENEIILSCGSNVLKLDSFPASEWSRDHVGCIGVAIYLAELELWRFDPYHDQSLRQRSDLDTNNRKGWCNDSNPDGWSAPNNIIPGKDGEFLEDETTQITIDVPREFFGVCAYYTLTPEVVLRGFIADACGLQNYVQKPRADGYSSNGSDERWMADDYLERAYAFHRMDIDEDDDL